VTGLLLDRLWYETRKGNPKIDDRLLHEAGSLKTREGQAELREVAGSRSEMGELARARTRFRDNLEATQAMMIPHSGWPELCESRFAFLIRNDAGLWHPRRGSESMHLQK
jgi:hypothetical protein